MKGLFFKDFYFLSLQKKFFLIQLLVCLLFLQTNQGISFTITYLAVISASSVIGTVSYDELNHSDAFLLTLPVSRRDYTIEKYVFGIFMWAIGLIASMVLIWLCSAFGSLQPIWTQISWNCFSSLLTALFFLAIMLPIRFQFGPEKGRYVLLLLEAAILLLAVSWESLLSFFGQNVTGIFRIIASAGPAVSLAILMGVCSIVFLSSFFFSIRIMEKKEF